MMKKTLPILVMAWAMNGCGLVKLSETKTESEAAPAVAQAAALAPAPAATPSASALSLDGQFQNVTIESYPGGTFAITEAGEYTVDVMGDGNFDPKSFLYREETKIADNDDGGEGRNDRIHAYLTPGNYNLRVIGYGGAKGSVRVKLGRALPVPVAGTATIGTPLSVTTRDAYNDRDASVAVKFTVIENGSYTVAVSGGGDPVAYLLRDSQLIKENDDANDNTHDARIQESLSPGEYEIRVRDHGKDEGTFQVLVTKN